MGWRKFKADLIFTGTETLPSESVLVTEESGFIQEIIPVRDAGDGIESFDGLLVPGLINTHCHLELSHMKGLISTGTGLVEFLTRVIKQRNFASSDLKLEMELADSEMYNKGIVAVGDICNTTDSIPVKQTSKIHWRNFIEVIGFTEQHAAERLKYSGNILTRFKETLLHPSSLTPHAPYSVSESLFLLINEECRGGIISIHNQETEAENDLYRSNSGAIFQLYKNLQIDPSFFKATGKSSLQSYLPWLGNQQKTLLVHNTYTSGEDIQFTGSNNGKEHTYFCICINANRYIESANPPLELLRAQHCKITIGTDSYASNRHLDVLEELKTIQQQFPKIPLSEMLAWATINGANALDMQEKLGSFEPGKQPGVVLINYLENQKLTAQSTARRII